jgi:CubicO group peptidase (beta-lactamase class C family)
VSPIKKNPVNPRTPRPGAIRLPLALLAFIAVVVTTLTASSALAQTPTEPSGPAGEPEVAPAGRGPTDGRELEAFLDGFFAQQLESSKIPGATVSVVKDGEVLFAKGYGEADVEAEEPVVAGETLFRIASTSKLFTSTAVMQLVEEGKLDLDEDVNAYLDDVEIPDTYPGRPVTLRHLLTHTAGFEESFTGSGARNAADVEPLGEYLSEPPGRVRPPGEVTSYSNYGMSLAGHVVEEASGMSFARYVEKNVTGPLGMDSTTAAQPPAPALREELATGYEIEGGEPAAGPFEYIDEAPAGSVSTTATDMARFMIAHLQDGRYGDARILDEATAREMHARQFSNGPRLDGMALGFYEQTMNGERVIEHGGNLLRFHALAALLPEEDIGIFVAYNSYGEGGDSAEYELLGAFLDRYYPEAAPPAPEPGVEGASGDAELVAGSYRSTRGNLTGFEKVFSLASPTSVTANEDGSITTSGVLTREDFTGAEQRWVQDGPMVFRAEGGDERLAFRQDGEGRVTYMSGDADPTSAFEKLPFYGSAKLHLGLLAGGLAVFGLTALAWPAGAMISWWYERRYRKLYGEPGMPGAKPGQDARGSRLARLLAWGLCVLALLFVGGMALVLSNATETLFLGDSPLLMATLALPFPVAALAVGVVVYAAISWKRRYWGLIGRLHYSLVALAALPFVALLGYYNLLGF